MKKPILGAAIATLCAVALGASAGEDFAEWSLENCVDAAGKPTTKIAGTTKCELRNAKKNACLIRQAHTGQVAWDFADCDKHPRSMLFAKEGGGELQCGDTVAMQLGWGGENHTEWFRKCASPQTAGIDVCSDDRGPEKKHYDWQLRCTGELAARKPFALYNVSRKDSVVFGKRPSKLVDTCWAEKTKYGQCLTVRDE